jgi:hypothetical protein
VTRRMLRGKQQILLKYLPGRTFDFEKIGTIAKVERIRGLPRTDLNLQLILRAISGEVAPWAPDLRPSFRNPAADASHFALVDPREVDAAMFPLVFWCQNPGCGVVLRTRDEVPTRNRCGVCNRGQIVQLRFVRVHRCGALLELTPPQCQTCGPRGRMALDTRDSERTSDFRWICRICSRSTSIFAGRCNACHWESDNGSDKNMNIEVHRAGRTYYPHTAVLLNQPGVTFSSFLALDRWQAIAAALYLGLPEVQGRSITDFVTGTEGDTLPTRLSEEEKAELRRRGHSTESIVQFEQMQEKLHGVRTERSRASSPGGLLHLLEQRTGVGWEVWEWSGQEILEAILPEVSGHVRSLRSHSQGEDASPDRSNPLVEQMGFAAVTLVTDFPITNVTYGFSRVSPNPGECRLNSFPADPDLDGRFPVFVDTVQADALHIRLNPAATLDWLRRNGCNPTLPRGSDPELSARAYFFELLNHASLRETIPSDHPEARLTFSLLHTFSHISLRRAAVLCGLDSTSLSEYVLPKTLSFAIYCNHRAGATIGALVALFEQSLTEWLSLVVNSQACVYDPVCSEKGGACHSCTQLAETSCRFFNTNLSRSTLFGGKESVLRRQIHGFLQPRPTRT